MKPVMVKNANKNKKVVPWSSNKMQSKIQTKSTARTRRKVPKKQVSVVVLMVLAMASVVTVMWLVEK